MWRRTYLVLFSGLLAIALLCSNSLQGLDNYLSDASLPWLFRQVGGDIVIIAIDGHSLRELGRWPWSRRTHADLINRLTDVGARAVGLDIIFAEPDKLDPEADQLLAKAIRDNGHVVLPVFPEPLNSPAGGVQAGLPMPELAQSAASLGHVDFIPDKDGKTRHIYLETGMDGPCWKSFAFEVLRVGRAKLPQEWQQEVHSTVEATPIGHWHRGKRMLITFAGQTPAYKQFSYADVLHGNLNVDQFRDKFVLVGATAAGLGQRFVSPIIGVSGPMTGVELNANIMDAYLQDRLFDELVLWQEILLTVALVVVPVWAFRLGGPRSAMTSLAIGLLMSAEASASLLKFAHLWFSPVTAWLVLALSYLFWNWQYLRRATHSLLAERRSNLATLNSLGEALIVTDTQGIVEYLNPIAERLTHKTSALACGKGIDELLAGLSGNEFGTQPPSEWIRKGGKLTQPSFLTNPLGEEYTVRLMASPIQDPKNEVSKILVVVSDISETVQISQQRNFLATHDALTKLPNRILLLERIEQALANVRKTGNHFALCFIDLDGFKKINDELGHDAGDFLLKEVSKLLSSNVRHVDTVSRWGGDEFVILLDNLLDDEAVAAVAVDILHAMTEPIVYQGFNMRVSPSIGISFYPRDGDNPDVLLNRADVAMYWVKQQGRNNFCFYSESLAKQQDKRTTRVVNTEC